MVQAVSRRRFNTMARVRAPVRFVVNTATPGQGFICEYFEFSLSVSLHQWSALNIMLFLPEGQTGKAWEPSKTQCSFVNRGTFDRKVL